MSEIKLDRETFKALASKTRIDILKLLQKRRHTQSEIAEALEMSVPTVKEHLSALETAGLVVKHEEGRKWKYFGLTKKTKAIFEPEQTKIWIVLVALIFSVIGGIVTAVRTFLVGATKFAAAKEAVPGMVAMEAEAGEVLAGAPPAAVAKAAAPHPLLLVFGIATIILVVLLIIFIIRSRKRKASLAKILKG
jgi:DNA-binding transcriptional ArsR family regulator